jgi:hypothetical protein
VIELADLERVNRRETLMDRFRSRAPGFDPASLLLLVIGRLRHDNDIHYENDSNYCLPLLLPNSWNPRFR